MNQVPLITRKPETTTVQTIGLQGITGSLELRSGKPTYKCCQPAMTHYYQIIIGHNGENLWFGNRQGWLTNIVRHEKMIPYNQHMENGNCIFTIRPEDHIIRVILCHSQMITEGMDRPILGLWQLISIRENNQLTEFILPRLLMATGPKICRDAAVH